MHFCVNCAGTLGSAIGDINGNTNYSLKNCQQSHIMFKVLTRTKYSDIYINTFFLLLKLFSKLA
jgi:hypothetical protein